VPHPILLPGLVQPTCCQLLHHAATTLNMVCHRVFAFLPAAAW
jgi:hypothetical protein